MRCMHGRKLVQQRGNFWKLLLHGRKVLRCTEEISGNFGCMGGTSKREKTIRKSGTAKREKF